MRHCIVGRYLPNDGGDLWWADEELGVGGYVVGRPGRGVLPGGGLGGGGHVQQVLHPHLQAGAQVPRDNHRLQSFIAYNLYYTVWYVTYPGSWATMILLLF